MEAFERWERRGIALRRSPGIAAMLVGLGVAIFSPLAFLLLSFGWGRHGLLGFRPQETMLRSWAPTVVSLCLLWFITTKPNRVRMAIAVLAASSVASMWYYAPAFRDGWAFIELFRAALLGIFLPFAFFEKRDWWRIPAVITFRFILYFTLMAIALGVLCGIVVASIVGALSGFSPWGAPPGVGLGNWTPSFVAGYAAGMAALIARCIMFFENPADIRSSSSSYSIHDPLAKL